MPDYIKGPVIEILDNHTIKVEVHYVGKNNRNQYSDLEIVLIDKLEPPFLKKIPIDKWQSRLEKKLVNVVVYCYILGKNKDGIFRSRVVCDGAEFRGKRKRV